MHSPAFTIISESQALRSLDLPSSRREWLRGQLPWCVCGATNGYRSEDVEQLREKLAPHRVLQDRSLKSPFVPVQLHTR